MGTDIHGRLQIRYGAEGNYIDAGPIEDDRNYLVFAILANIRNGKGFAGVETHKPISPISEPRGLPSDFIVHEDDGVLVSAGYDENEKALTAREWLGDHSHSWLTLKEIIDWPHWSDECHMTGLVGPDEMARMRLEGGPPHEWCGGISGPEAYTYTRVNWKTPVAERVGTFKLWIDYIASKYAWQLECDPEAVRIVFGFDS